MNKEQSICDICRIDGYCNLNTEIKKVSTCREFKEIAPMCSLFIVCLNKGIKIPDFKLFTILKKYRQYRMPTKELKKLTNEKINQYVKGLWLSGQEMSREWSEGHTILKELGFKEVENRVGHRVFLSLEWK